MAKSSGNTRASGSRSPRGLAASNGRGAQAGVLRDTQFSPNAKLSEFLDEGQFVNGGSYSLTSSDGYTMRIDTENGYNEDYGTNGTLILVSATSPSGNSETLVRSFVEGTPFRESGGREVYSNDSAVKRMIEGSMPYYAERVNRWKNNN